MTTCCNRYRRISAYMTLEASYIVPIVFLIFIIIIYFIFYLFNHCVVYQSVYASGLRGQQIKGVSDAAVKIYIEEQASDLLDEQIYQYQIDCRVDVGITGIEVAALSSINNGLQKFGLYDVSNFITERKARLPKINETQFIRLYHRWK